MSTEQEQALWFNEQLETEGSSCSDLDSLWTGWSSVQSWQPEGRWLEKRRNLSLGFFFFFFQIAKIIFPPCQLITFPHLCSPPPSNA